MMLSLDSESTIFSSSNKGAREETARQRYQFLKYFFFVWRLFLFIFLIFCIYVLETDASSLPTCVL